MRLGLSPDEFWSLTPVELLLMSKRENHRTKQTWRVARWLAAIVVNIFRAKGKPAVTPERLLKLDDDDHQGREQMSKERFDYLATKWPKTFQKRSAKK